MSFEFTNPQWLGLLLPAWVWIGWLARHSDMQISPLRRWLACTIRFIVVGALILSLGGLQWLKAVEGMTVLFVLDRSDSVPAAEQERAREWVSRVVGDKVPGDRVGVVVFGARAAVDTSPAVAVGFPGIDTVVPTERTDIAGAIRLAASAFPEFGQRRIVLVSDGNENLGDARNAAASARAMNVNVDVVPVGSRQRSDISIRRLELPPRLKEGQPFEAKVFVQAEEPGPAIFRLYRNDQYLGEQEVRLDRGRNLLAFPQLLRESGFYAYEVRVDAPGARGMENTRAFAFTQVRGLPRVLIVSNDPAADHPLLDALQGPELEVSLRDVTGFPDSLAALQSYDSLVLCNVAAGDLARDQRNLLETAVRDFGMGLVCIGGDQAYAAGAYHGTPLADVLPVEVELSSRKVLPPGALVLVIDRSGSMAGEKVEMARQGATAAVQALSSNDYVGVIAFDGAQHLVADIQRAGDRREVLGGIMGMDAGGGTVMYPALAGAHQMLRRVTASFKHCVVLTDGVSAPDDFEGITRAMVADHITVSTVGIGQDIDANLLQMIAEVGQGRFFPVAFPQQLPQILLKEAAVVLKSAISEEPFTPQLVSSSELIRGIGAADYPQLLGHVSTQAKLRAEVPLLTHTGDPLLAHWQHGLGRAVAFTSDARARWAKAWVDWERYRQFWRQVVHWSVRRLDGAELVARVSTGGDEGHLGVEAFDAQGGFRDSLQLQSMVVGPDGRREAMPLKQTAPGFYEAEFAMRDSGIYLLTLLQIENGQPRPVQVVGASRTGSPEHDSVGPNLALLHHLAESTGGTVLDPTLPGSSPFHDDRRRTWQPHTLSWSLLKLVILLFVVDVGVRRLNPDPDDLVRAFRRALGVAWFWRRTPATTPSSEPSLAALLIRRHEVRARHSNQSLPVEGRGAPPGSLASIPRTPAASSLQPTGAGIAASPEPSESGEKWSTANRLLAAKRRATTTR